MSVREYIGARYVPLFADPLDWDITKTYEPLTIVYYQGNSYTSRQAVPSGIAITNTTFWALTGNYNAQIEAYRAEVQEFADDMGELDEKVEAFADDINELNAALPKTVFNETNTVDARFDIIEANNWVTTPRINNNAVTTEKIANGSVTKDKMNSELLNILETVYNVKDYGAVGDGTTDDTNAFKACIAAASQETGGYVYIPTNNGELYRITEELEITNDFMTFYSNAQYNLDWNSGIKFEPSSMDSILFKVNASGCRFENIIMTTNRNYLQYLGTAIRAGMENAPDTDIKINGCSFLHFETAVEHYDRGLRFCDNLVAECTTAINVYTSANLPSTGNNTMRAIAISRNRLHQIIYFVKINASKPHGIVITDNYLDAPPYLNARSLTLIYADSSSEISGGIISNNTILDSHDYTIDIQCEVYNLIIAENDFHNTRGANIEGYISIEYLHSSEISNNSMIANNKDTMKFNRILQSLITGNRLSYACLSSNTPSAPNYAAIRILTSLGTSMISNNLMIFNYSGYSRCICYDGTSAVSDVRITENWSGRSEIFTNTNSVSVSSCKIQASNID